MVLTLEDSKAGFLGPTLPESYKKGLCTKISKDVKSVT